MSFYSICSMLCHHLSPTTLLLPNMKLLILGHNKYRRPAHTQQQTTTTKKKKKNDLLKKKKRTTTNNTTKKFEFMCLAEGTYNSPGYHTLERERFPRSRLQITMKKQNDKSKTRVSRNVYLTLSMCAIWGLADSIWNGTILAAWLYLLSDGKNSFVGYIEAASGLAALVVALPIGYVGDKMGAPQSSRPLAFYSFWRLD